MPLKQHTTILPNTRNTNYNLYKSKTEEFTTSHTLESPLLSNENLNSLKEIKEADHGFSKWFK
jgi:retron-type reverse transcriptase